MTDSYITDYAENEARWAAMTTQQRLAELDRLRDLWGEHCCVEDLDPCVRAADLDADISQLALQIVDTDLQPP